MGSVRGVDVLVRSSWLLVAVLIAVALAPRIEEVEPGLGVLKYVAGVAFAVLFYLSLLLHEISHALMAQRPELSPDMSGLGPEARWSAENEALLLGTN